MPVMGRTRTSPSGRRETSLSPAPSSPAVTATSSAAAAGRLPLTSALDNAATTLKIEGNVVLAGDGTSIGNPFVGTTEVYPGATLQLGNANAVASNAGAFTLDGIPGVGGAHGVYAVLDLNGYSVTLTGLYGTGDVTNDDWSPAKLTVNVPAGTRTPSTA